MKTPPQPDGDLVSERIIDFFFPTRPRVGTRRNIGFFDHSIKDHSEPTRTAEAISEIYALRFAIDPRYFADNLGDAEAGAATIVRTSGNKRFVQVAPDGKLTSSGQATLEAIRSGVKVWFIYPRSTEAEDSVQCFESVARKSLSKEHLRNLNKHPIRLSQRVRIGSRRFWAGDYVSRVLRFVFHECSPSSDLDELPWRNLLMSRAPRFGPTVWNPTGEEIDEFSDWFNAIRN